MGRLPVFLIVSILLTILRRVHSQTVSLTVFPDDGSFASGALVKLECNASGNVTWLRDNVLISSSEKFRMMSKSSPDISVLTINPFDATTEGCYNCQAGKPSRRVCLKLQVEFQFGRLPSNQSVYEGDLVEITITVKVLPYAISLFLEFEEASGGFSTKDTQYVSPTTKGMQIVKFELTAFAENQGWYSILTRSGRKEEIIDRFYVTVKDLMAPKPPTDVKCELISPSEAEVLVSWNGSQLYRDNKNGRDRPKTFEVTVESPETDFFRQDFVKEGNNFERVTDLHSCTEYTIVVAARGNVHYSNNSDACHVMTPFASPEIDQFGIDDLNRILHYQGGEYGQLCFSNEQFLQKYQHICELTGNLSFVDVSMLQHKISYYVVKDININADFPSIDSLTKMSSSCLEKSSECPKENRVYRPRHCHKANTESSHDTNHPSTNPTESNNGVNVVGLAAGLGAAFVVALLAIGVGLVLRHCKKRHMRKPTLNGSVAIDCIPVQEMPREPTFDELRKEMLKMLRKLKANLESIRRLSSQVTQKVDEKMIDLVLEISKGYDRIRIKPKECREDLQKAVEEWKEWDLSISDGFSEDQIRGFYGERSPQLSSGLVIESATTSNEMSVVPTMPESDRVVGDCSATGERHSSINEEHLNPLIEKIQFDEDVLMAAEKPVVILEDKRVQLFLRSVVGKNLTFRQKGHKLSGDDTAKLLQRLALILYEKLKEELSGADQNFQLARICDQIKTEDEPLEETHVCDILQYLCRIVDQGDSSSDGHSDESDPSCREAIANSAKAVCHRIRYGQHFSGNQMEAVAKLLSTLLQFNVSEEDESSTQV
eukprot:m.218593 g.218593  ORF g.218593 m.218593 type:complete len:828 (+) comp39900_c1_seq10:63-2546(+)